MTFRRTYAVRHIRAFTGDGTELQLLDGSTPRRTGDVDWTGYEDFVPGYLIMGERGWMTVLGMSRPVLESHLWIADYQYGLELFRALPVYIRERLAIDCPIVHDIEYLSVDSLLSLPRGVALVEVIQWENQLIHARKDPDVRLVYSDWLEERSLTERAAAVRAEAAGLMILAERTVDRMPSLMYGEWPVAKILE